MTKTAVMVLEDRRKEFLRLFALLMTVVAMLLVNMPTSHAGARVEVLDNVEWYSLGPYDSHMVTDNYEDLRSSLEKEQRLVKVTTVIKQFKEVHSIYHELLATTDKIEVEGYKAKERVVFYTDSPDQAEKFIYNMKDEMPGWGRIQTLTLTANDLVIVTFER